MPPFQVGNTRVADCPMRPPSRPVRDPSTMVLAAGHKKEDSSRALPVDVLFERDHVVALRDGTRVRVDIFRPTDSSPRQKAPAILMWGPYGKSGEGALNLAAIPLRAGVAASSLSGYEGFEGLDPAEWVARGYAIVNVDPRGINDSEGNMRWWGTAEGKDGHDVVEEIAKKEWCNGKVGLAGNSWLAIAQWFIAAERPPHLAAIAPFEGQGDGFREGISRGGVELRAFPTLIGHILTGRQRREDAIAMLNEYPFMNDYWDDKKARADKIKVPTYAVASYSTGLHSVGTFSCWDDIPHEEKWLVVHGTQEWYDLYSTERTEDLAVFFERYLKDVRNGWEKRTPRVRSSIYFMGGKEAQTNIPLEKIPWCVPEAKTQSLFLLPDCGMASETYASSPATTMSFRNVGAPDISFATDLNHILTFRYTFPEAATLMGPSKLTIPVSVLSSPSHQGQQDIDICVQVRKADASGKLLEQINQPLSSLGVSSPDEVPTFNPLKYYGPQGWLRASRRKPLEPDTSRSSTWWKVLDQRKESEAPVSKDEVVDMEIYVWPTAIKFDKGEILVVNVSGKDMAAPELPGLPDIPPQNPGVYTVHLGGGKEGRFEFTTV
ncbi:Cocaine esterase [Zalerion maritima]|uniref:Cocaine esterase n=1 Tax=Zalerion maritima TaxID=339359 RepID=A0AAD5RZW6_9PEZI|nr:Cocaine esterase [Zalerion maritima]